MELLRGSLILTCVWLNFYLLLLEVTIERNVFFLGELQLLVRTYLLEILKW